MQSTLLVPERKPKPPQFWHWLALSFQPRLHPSPHRQSPRPPIFQFAEVRAAFFRKGHLPTHWHIDPIWLFFTLRNGIPSQPLIQSRKIAYILAFMLHSCDELQDSSAALAKRRRELQLTQAVFAAKSSPVFLCCTLETVLRLPLFDRVHYRTWD